MPDLLTDPAHWQLRAHEARGQAQKLSDPEAKAAKHQMAEKYERLAARATEWMNKVQDVPRVPRSAPPTAPQTVSVIEACVARPRYSKTFGGKREPARAKRQPMVIQLSDDGHLQK